MCNCAMQYNKTLQHQFMTLTAIHIPLIRLIFLITGSQRAGDMRGEERGPWSVVCAPNFQSLIAHDIKHVTLALLSIKLHLAPS